MPATWSAKQCFIRIDFNDHNKVIDFFKDHQSIFIVQHTHREDNLHYHIAVSYKTEITKQTLTNRLKTFFNVAKDKFMIKKWDGKDEACSYMLNEEKKPVLVFTTYTEDVVLRLKDKNQAVQDRKEKTKSKKTEVSRWDMVLEIRNLSGITDIDLTNWKYHNDISINKEFVYENMIKVLEKHHKLAHITELERMYVSVLRVAFNASEDFFQKIKSKTEV